MDGFKYLMPQTGTGKSDLKATAAMFTGPKTQLAWCHPKSSLRSARQSPASWNTTVVVRIIGEKESTSAASSLKPRSEAAVSLSYTCKISTGCLPIWIGDLTLSCVQVCFTLPQQIFHDISFTPKERNCFPRLLHARDSHDNTDLSTPT